MLEKISEKIVKVGQGAVKSTQKIAEINILNGKIKDEKRVLEGYYAEAGRRYYQFLQDGTQEKEILQLVDAITIQKNRIKELIEKLHELKGSRLCQSCGEEIMMDAVYCSYCGEKQDPLEEKIQNTCKNCGWVMESEDLFCSNCGAKKE